MEKMQKMKKRIIHKSAAKMSKSCTDKKSKHNVRYVLHYSFSSKRSTSMKKMASNN